ncbi:MAG: FG-GAP-like repeat-containing protein [Nannocystaceae bacterium]
MVRSTPRSRLAARLVAGLLVVGACGDDGPPEPDPGVAADDYYTVAEGQPLVIEADAGVLVNDGDPSLKVDSYRAISSKLGTVVVQDDGSFSYAPLEGFWGHDSFTYTIIDPVLGESTGTVNVMVLPVTLALEGLAGSNRGVVLDGRALGDMLGLTVAGLGDINGDDRDDVLLGSPMVNQALINNGRAYVVLGHDDPTSLDSTSLASGVNGFVINGKSDDDRLAAAAAGAGDVNGDGLGDFVVCAPRVDLGGDDSGRCYVVFGRADFEATLNLGAIEGGSGGFVINGSTWDARAGYAVGGGGDVNGDGLDDVVIGAPNYADLDFDRGRAWVVYGKSGGGAVELADVANGAGGFALTGLAAYEWAGAAVAIVGDVDGDGRADVLVGAPFATVADADYGGHAYLVYGGHETDAPDVHFEVADGRARMLGHAVAGVGDVNGDGLDDFAIGAPEAKIAKSQREGETYVVFGGGRDAGTVDLAVRIANGGGLLIRGEPQIYGLAGLSVAGAGDLDGDGVGDLMIAAPYADIGGRPSAGRVYVVFGRRTGGVVELADVAQGVGGFAMDGEADGARAGVSLDAIGDFDGDKVIDLAVGASHVAPNGEASGRAYVLFGFGPPSDG